MKAHPGDVRASDVRVRHEKIDTNGTVTLRCGSRLLHVAIGRAYVGQVVTMLVAHRDVRVMTPEGHLRRHLIIDPTRPYQAVSKNTVSTMS